MKIKSACFAAGITVGIVYIACIAVFAAAPQLAVAFGSLIFHGVKVEPVPVSAVNAVAGFVVAVVGSAVIAGIFAALYNKFLKK